MSQKILRQNTWFDHPLIFFSANSAILNGGHLQPPNGHCAPSPPKHSPAPRTMVLGQLTQTVPHCSNQL